MSAYGSFISSCKLVPNVFNLCQSTGIVSILCQPIAPSPINIFRSSQYHSALGIFKNMIKIELKFKIFCVHRTVMQSGVEIISLAYNTILGLSNYRINAQVRLS